LKYAKALITLAVSVAGALITALGTSPQQSLNGLSTLQWVTVVGSILGSSGLVWWTENVPGVAGGVIKTLVAGATAGVASVAIALNDGVISQAEWLTAFSAAAVAAAAVYQVANKLQPNTP
jgi:hypothetical protein